MKRWLSLLLVLCLPAVAVMPTYAVEAEVSAASAILMDADTGEVLYEKNAERRMLIASTTKIMTALITIEYGGLRDIVTVKQEHMAEGSSMYLKPGEELTVEALLYGLMLCSGNDAALALADHCGGTEQFVSRMNETARRIGMENTSFANPNGLDDEVHYSTARDLALLAAYAADNPTFMRICSTSDAAVGSRTMTNHNKLLRRLDGCVGMKTGYTKAAGRTLVSCVRRDGHCLVAVTLQDGNDWVDHEALYAYGFAQLAVRNEDRQ